jgi:glyoxylase-like metal-dependent hydrolase (beta-lactamase superfamily II)
MALNSKRSEKFKIMEPYKTFNLSEKITQISDPTGVSCFLIKGEKHAALIDTGVGIAGLKEIVCKQTSLPVDVILTHGHVDHAGGAAAFEKAYLHPNDFSLAAKHSSMEMRMDYSRHVLPPKTYIDQKEFIQPMNSEFLPLEDGQIFDLGGITLEIIHVPGHTSGSVCILFREERAMLYGDACNINTLILDDSSITEYYNSLLKLQKWDNTYDKAYFSHGPAIGPRQCLADNIELCQKIMTGTDDAIPFEFMGIKAFRAAETDNNYCRLDGKFGNIVYTQNNVR